MADAQGTANARETAKARDAAGAPAIVVGVDGSPHGLVALHAAVRQAELTGGTLTAVLAWDMPSLFGQFPPPPAPGAQHPTFQERAEMRLDDMLREALNKDPGALPGPRLRQRAVQGDPTKVLLEAAQEADLLVVGSRGYGGFRGMLLGSVSQHLSQYAPCSVLIVREPGDAGDD